MISAADGTGAEMERARRRHRRLFLAAAATLAVTVWAALQPDETAAPASRPRASANPGVVTEPPGGTPIGATARPTAALPAWPQPPDASRRQAWPAALAPGIAAWSGTAEPAPQPAPTRAATISVPALAPPFPYTLIGRLDDGEAQALLSGPRRSFGVKAADVIDGEWRVDSVQARGLTLTWLPGGVRATLVLGPS